MGGVRSRVGARLSADARVARLRAAEAKRAGRRGNGRDWPRQVHGRGGAAGLINIRSAGTDARRNEEGK
jgi:hypothetical protein